VTPFDSIFEAAAGRYGVPQRVIEAVARTESSLNPRAVGDDGESYGMFQMYRPTARRYGVVNMTDLWDPAYATDRAVAYMADIIRDQRGLNLPFFYSEYNSGSPGAWQTSGEVFAHVQNFLGNYDLSATGAVAVGSSGALVLAAVGLWWWKGRRA